MRSQEYFGGTTAVLAILIFAAGLATSSPAQSFKTLVSFDNTDGGVPVYMSLIQGADGNLYGTTGYGGTNKMGTVFKISATGALTSLYDFCTQANCADGSFSFSSLALGRGRNFYGTTKNLAEPMAKGRFSESPPQGCSPRCTASTQLTAQSLLRAWYSLAMATFTEPQPTVGQTILALCSR
jgi:uncharacterized repeat protein (TIGR03803 family)